MKTDERNKDLETREETPDAPDSSGAQSPAHRQRRINVDCPVWMIESLDSEADRLGVARQSLIKVWLAERLERLPSQGERPVEPSEDA